MLSIFFAIDFIQKRKLRFIFEIILLVLTFSFLGYSIYLNATRKYYRYSLEESVNKKLNRIGFVRIIPGNYDADCSELFYEKIKDIHGIEAASQVSAEEYSGTFWSELVYLENNLNQEEDIDNTFFEVYNVQPDFLLINDIFLEKGELISYEEIKQKGNKWSGIYLENDLSEIPVGTTYYYENGYCCEVLGILKKGSTCIDERIISGSISAEDIGIADLDKISIMISTPIQYDFFFSLNDEGSYEEVKNNIFSVAEEMGLVIKVGNIESVVEAGEKECSVYSTFFMKCFFIVSVVTICCISAFQIIAVSDNYEEFGVLTACGISTSKLVLTEVIQMLLKYLLAISIVSILFVYEIVLPSAALPRNEYSEFKKITGYIIKHYVLIRLICITMVVMILSTIIPIMVIRLKKPVDILRGRNT